MRLRRRGRMEAGAAIGHLHAHGVHIELDVEPDPLAGAAVADGVRDQLGDEQAQGVELVILDRALEPVECLARLAGSLGPGTHRHVQPRDDVVPAQLDGRPHRLFPASFLKARKRRRCGLKPMAILR